MVMGNTHSQTVHTMRVNYLMVNSVAMEFWCSLGSNYEGEFENGDYHGFGIHTDSDGETIVDNWMVGPQRDARISHTSRKTKQF